MASVTASVPPHPVGFLVEGSAAGSSTTSSCPLVESMTGVASRCRYVFRQIEMCLDGYSEKVAADDGVRQSPLDASDQELSHTKVEVR